MNNHQDTICAIATPNGLGAISVIRLSGKESLKIIQAVFSKDLSDKASHTVHFGNFLSGQNVIIDEVLVTVFQQGKSFTGEESIEISCHASPYIQQQILKTLMEQGCRLAEPGEFTMRAFMNGKMDLSQAEAVADLIASQSKSAHDIALKQLKGGFSSELKELREKLIHFASLVELELDFAEEDVEFADRKELKQLVIDVLAYIQRLARSFELGNAIKNGVPVAIVGAPNTGKSTLLNQLLGEDRAIVSNIAGTTRDVIEETLNIDGILFRLIDTAGIRENAEEIEAMGIERSKEKIRQAAVVLCMADSTVDGSLEEVLQWAQEIRETYPDKKVLVLANKADMNSIHTARSLSGVEEISAKEGKGIDELKKELVAQVVGDFSLANDTIVSNARHYDALRRTAESLEKARFGLENNITADFVAMDIRQAMYDLGTITGDISTDDLLGNIFSKFCIGK
ncbi:MAG: tRNA uridine-5-carboxymethylaminomethyl(34) synthesis GTPase MnmE [Flavobacteriia bacterium]|jgi:tRNA modification GTPase